MANCTEPHVSGGGRSGRSGRKRKRRRRKRHAPEKKQNLTQGVRKNMKQTPPPLPLHPAAAPSLSRGALSLIACMSQKNIRPPYRHKRANLTPRSARSAPGHVVRLSVVCLRMYRRGGLARCLDMLFSSLTFCLCMYRREVPRSPCFARLARRLDMLFGSLSWILALWRSCSYACQWA